MPPSQKRDVVVVLYDMNMENKQMAKSTIQELYCKYQFGSAKETEVQLILLGSGITSNPEDIPNVNCIQGLQYFNLNLLRRIDELEEGERDNCAYNWLEALNLGLNLLQNYNKDNGIQTLKLYFITDLTTKITENGDQNLKLVENIIETLSSNEKMYIYILGPFDSNTTKPLQSLQDIELWKNSAVFCKENSPENLQLLKNLVTQAKIIVAHPDIGLPLSFFYKVLWGLQAWSEPLQIYKDCELNVGLRRLVDATPVQPKISVSDEGFETKTVYRENEEEECKISDVVSGIKSNGKFEPYFTDEFYKFEEKSFHLIGFVAQNDIPDVYISNETTFYVVNLEPDNGILDELINILIEQSKYAIVRRKYGQKRFKPKYGVLVPLSEPSLHFIYKELPMADDIFNFFKESSLEPTEEDLNKIEKSLNNYESVAAYLDGFNSNNNDPLDALAINLRCNPSITKKLKMLSTLDVETCAVEEDCKVKLEK